MDTESIIGLRLDQNGQVIQETQHTDGKVSSEPMPDKQTQGALTEKKHGGLKRSEHVERSLRVEKVLLKGMSSARGAVPLDSQCKSILMGVLEAMGGDFAKKAAIMRETFGAAS